VLTIAVFSLAGVPPTAGFFGKFFLLLSGAGHGNYLLVSIAALNMIIAFYYYLRIVRVMFMDHNEAPIQRLAIPVFPRLALYLCLAGIIFIGFLPFIYDQIHSLSTIY
jgi:NADH-quinone oxidoreductase subunit N